MIQNIQHSLLLFGERGIKLYKWKNPISSYIVAQFLMTVILSSFCAFGVNYLISDTFANHIFLSEKHASYWEELCNQELIEFQEYVTENKLTCEQALASSRLGDMTSEIVLYYEQFPAFDHNNTEHQEFLDKYQENRIICIDGDIYATSYSPGKGYRTKWKIQGMIAGTVCASMILLAYIIYLLHRIKNLHRQVFRSKQGGQDAVISIRGQDEIFELGENIESMRKTLWDLLEQEQQTQNSQNQLIASLSHDIRTPLTKLIGYLEILAYHKVSSQQEQENYLHKAVEKVQQLKCLTDNLFNCVLVKGKLIYDDRELVNGPEFLTQMLYEGFCELEMEGFTLELPQLSGEYTLNVRIDSMQRICDNLSSNIMKYGNKEQPVCINVTDKEDMIYISISNHKATKRKDVPHHGLGMPTVKNLIQELGGTLMINDTKHQYIVYLTLPKIEMNTTRVGQP